MRIFVSIGDPNGIGLEIALRAHEEVSKEAEIVYGVDSALLSEAARRLDLAIPRGFEIAPLGLDFPINPGIVAKEAGRYSYESFLAGIEATRRGDVDALVTLPIHKKAWNLAGIPYAGHTEALRDIFEKDAIMMMGIPSFYVALYSDHIPLSHVPKLVTKDGISKFLLRFFSVIPNMQSCGVLGLNPHAGDEGVLGDEEREIELAIHEANEILGREVFFGPLVPDVAFLPHFRARFRHYVALYHDQGLIALKLLYFQESINVSLGLPIIRTSVDHGTAFDIAYKKANLCTLSYHNAIKVAVELQQNKQ